MKIQERTCKCIKDLVYEDQQFYKGHEYQVDVYSLFYKIYRNGGWDDYIFISGDDWFNEHFKMIE